MTILGFTTSTDFSSLALFSKNKIVKQFSWTRNEQQSEALTLHIKNYLKKNKTDFKDLTLIAVDKGPGSFTGSRIAVNIAKTLAFDLKIPIFVSSSLDLMAFGAMSTLTEYIPLTIICVLDAHKSLFYFRKYNITDADGLVGADSIRALSLEQIVSEIPDQGHLCLLGNLKLEPFNFLKSEISTLKPKIKLFIPKAKVIHTPQAQFLVSQAAKSITSDHFSWADVEPSYIRSPDAVEKLFPPK